MCREFSTSRPNFAAHWTLGRMNNFFRNETNNRVTTGAGTVTANPLQQDEMHSTRNRSRDPGKKSHKTYTNTFERISNIRLLLDDWRATSKTKDVRTFESGPTVLSDPVQRRPFGVTRIKLFKSPSVPYDAIRTIWFRRQTTRCNNYRYLLARILTVYLSPYYTDGADLRTWFYTRRTLSVFYTTLRRLYTLSFIDLLTAARQRPTISGLKIVTRVFRTKNQHEHAVVIVVWVFEEVSVVRKI